MNLISIEEYKTLLENAERAIALQNEMIAKLTNQLEGRPAGGSEAVVEVEEGEEEGPGDGELSALSLTHSLIICIDIFGSLWFFTGSVKRRESKSEMGQLAAEMTMKLAASEEEIKTLKVVTVTICSCVTAYALTNFTV